MKNQARLANPSPSVSSLGRDAPAAEASIPPLRPTAAGAVSFDPGPCGCDLLANSSSAFLMREFMPISENVTQFSFSSSVINFVSLRKCGVDRECSIGDGACNG